MCDRVPSRQCYLPNKDRFLLRNLKWPFPFALFEISTATLRVGFVVFRIETNYLCEIGYGFVQFAFVNIGFAPVGIRVAAKVDHVCKIGDSPIQFPLLRIRPSSLCAERTVLWIEPNCRREVSNSAVELVFPQVVHPRVA